MDHKVLYSLSYGMYGITVADQSRPTGCIVNTVFQITSEGPIIALSLNHNNYTHEVLEKTKRFAVSILSEKTNPEVISKLGFFSGRDTDKMQGISYKMIDDLAVLDENCCGYMICEVVGITKTATHDVFLGKVVAGEVLSKEAPMTYSYYRNVVKGTSPKNAPSYQAVTSAEAEEQYVCDVCNYVYNGDITKEGADYRCPVCGVDRSHFQKTPPKGEKKFVCDVCNYVYNGDIEKEGEQYRCPICGVDRSHFKEVK